jgi:hypothetical protein
MVMAVKPQRERNRLRVWRILLQIKDIPGSKTEVRESKGSLQNWRNENGGKETGRYKAGEEDTSWIV